MVGQSEGKLRYAHDGRHCRCGLLAVAACRIAGVLIGADSHCAGPFVAHRSGRLQCGTVRSSADRVDPPLGIRQQRSFCRSPRYRSRIVSRRHVASVRRGRHHRRLCRRAGCARRCRPLPWMGLPVFRNQAQEARRRVRRRSDQRMHSLPCDRHNAAAVRPACRLLPSDCIGDMLAGAWRKRTQGVRRGECFPRVLRNAPHPDKRAR